MLVFVKLLIAFSISMYSMCYIIFVQRFEPRGRRFTNFHFLNCIIIIVIIKDLSESGEPNPLTPHSEQSPHPNPHPGGKRKSKKEKKRKKKKQRVKCMAITDGRPSLPNHPDEHA